MEQCWGILVQIQSKADSGIILSEPVAASLVTHRGFGS
jgi:hypothetical protein